MKIHITAANVKVFLVVGICIICVLIIYSNIVNKQGSFDKFSKNFVLQVLAAGNDKLQYSNSVTKENYSVTNPVSKGESYTCKAMQDLFGKPFYSVRPDFLKSPITGHNLEIDCFNPELNMGAEYNGRQHYYYTPKFHKSFQDFRNGQYRDYIKKDLCERNGTKLISVPYTVPYNKIKEYIYKNF